MRKETVRVIIIIAAFYLGVELVGITCPIRFLTGISCAGCGMSRAWLSVLRLDVATAFSYHPLFFLPPVVSLVWFFRNRIPKGLLRFSGIGILVLFLAVYGIRLLDPGDSVATFSPREGLFLRIITGIFNL